MEILFAFLAIGASIAIGGIVITGQRKQLK